MKEMKVTCDICKKEKTTTTIPYTHHNDFAKTNLFKLEGDSSPDQSIITKEICSECLGKATQELRDFARQSKYFYPV